MKNQTAPIAKRRQVAAVCYRQTKAGKQVLLITSRDTGRWIVPKGWPIKGLDDSGSALQEAWEEAGVSQAQIDPCPIGQYDYDKGMPNGQSKPIETQVFLAKVHDIAKKYPEEGQRTRKWFTPEAAAKLVREPDLKSILRKV
ncbi:MAG: NUDIX hydrolase [Sulfitobacter sp.]